MRFESNVSLDRYKTKNIETKKEIEFESNVILDRYKTWLGKCIQDGVFESNVILDRYKTNKFIITYGYNVWE